VETQLQQGWSALEEARATLEHERSAREEAQGQLQQERAAPEEAQATLKLWDLEVTRLSSELVQEGVSYEELRQAGKEKDIVILELQQAAATTRSSLESEKKQVEGESPFLSFTCWLGSFGIHSQLGLCLGFQVCGRLLGTQRPRRRPSRRPTTLLSRSWRRCRSPPLRRARVLKKVRRRPRAPWRVVSVLWAGTSLSACTAHSTWGSRKPLTWWRRTTESISRRSLRAMSSPSASTTRWR
jgi:hypothetical protein